MDISLNSKHFSDAAKNPIVLSILLIAGFIWLMMDRVITREDQILEQGAEVQREISESRIEMAAGFQALQRTFEAAEAASALRAADWIAAIDRLGRLAAAQCYIDADTPEDQRRCTNADTGN